MPSACMPRCVSFLGPWDQEGQATLAGREKARHSHWGRETPLLKRAGQHACEKNRGKKGWGAKCGRKARQCARQVTCAKCKTGKRQVRRRARVQVVRGGGSRGALRKADGADQRGDTIRDVIPRHKKGGMNQWPSSWESGGRRKRAAGRALGPPRAGVRHRLCSVWCLYAGAGATFASRERKQGG
jgi:hypothetical protein